MLSSGVYCNWCLSIISKLCDQFRRGQLTCNHESFISFTFSSLRVWCMHFLTFCSCSFSRLLVILGLSDLTYEKLWRHSADSHYTDMKWHERIMSCNSVLRTLRRCHRWGQFLDSWCKCLCGNQAFTGCVDNKFYDDSVRFLWHSTPIIETPCRCSLNAYLCVSSCTVTHMFE